MARPRLRVEIIPHARDKTISLIRYRAGRMCPSRKPRFHYQTAARKLFPPARPI